VSLAARALLGLLRGYQLLVSPLLPSACRYHPTCSHYAAEAVVRFGAARGAWLALKRLGRCHPWGGQGYDPVPHVAEPRIAGGGRLASPPEAAR
jgi:uncharacterized protein